MGQMRRETNWVWDACQHGVWGETGNAYGSVDALLAILDEDRDFAGAGGFQDFGQLCDGLLEDLGRADVDLGDDDHDRDV